MPSAGLLLLMFCWAAALHAQAAPAAASAARLPATLEVTLRVEPAAAGRGPRPAAVAWLTAAHPDPRPDARPDSLSDSHSAAQQPLPDAARTTPGYTLLQKDKQFQPHLLVVPVGSVVHFPNADPFFHNVFSLFDGRRFDLGLYEAGTTRDVTFPREGVSYIFCNIHPEMSAVILSLATPFYARAEPGGGIRLHAVPPGGYTLHVWVEGLGQAALESLTRPVVLAAGHADLATVLLPAGRQPVQHANKFGEPYDAADPAPY